MAKKDKYYLKTLAQNIGEIIEPVCEAEGIEFVHAECLSGESGMLIRFYLDKPNGITIDDLTGMSRQFDDLLDVHFDNLGSYRLEVSSPGLDRPLSKKKDFKRFVGNRVKIKINEFIEKRKEFTGILKNVTEAGVTIDSDNKEFFIEFEQMNKARLANH
ncbi:MAG: ribosome maturation factor RimP [Desulfobacteraceae bacterium]|nr:ribosome maturation factor RimP [Desulfobacteraceae bacterium]